MALTFTRRAVITRTDLAQSRHYYDRNGDWELVEVRWLPPYDQHFADYWAAIKKFGDRQFSRHKTRQAAEAACRLR